MSIPYEQELHDYWKNIIDGGYVNLPSKDTISYWLSHIEICHEEIERLQKVEEQLETVKVYFGFGIFNSQLWDWIINKSKNAPDYTCYTRDLQESFERLQGENAKLRELVGELVYDSIFWFENVNKYISRKNTQILQRDILSTKHNALIQRAQEVIGE